MFATQLLDRRAKTSPAPQVSCTIKCQDYRRYLKSLAAGSIDLILTDPPYAISRRTGFASVKNGVDRFAVSMDFGTWDQQEIDLPALATEAYRVLRPGGTCIVWYDVWKLTTLAESLQAAKFRMLRLIIWKKTNPVPLNSKVTYLSNAREIAVAAVKGTHPVFASTYDNGEYVDEVYPNPIPRHKGKRIHPTQKPLSLFTQLVQKHSQTGALICDPFLGSGTTALAACNAHRSFTGCDIEQKYVAAAKKRVSSASNTLTSPNAS